MRETSKPVSYEDILGQADDGWVLPRQTKTHKELSNYSEPAELEYFKTQNRNSRFALLQFNSIVIANLATRPKLIIRISPRPLP